MASSKESSFFRSADMSFCQLFLPSDSAYQCVSELGEAGIVQFKDLNEELNTHQRKFVNEVRRCDEMERKLRFIEEEILNDGLTIIETTERIAAPLPKEMVELEATIEKIDVELATINANAKALQDSYIQLWEMARVTEHVTEMLAEGSGKEAVSAISDSVLLEGGEMKENGSSNLKQVTGVIRRDRVHSFELILWRLTKGKVFMRFYECYGDSHNDEDMTVFILFFSGEQLTEKVAKICSAFHARIYNCPENPHDRQGLLERITRQIIDINAVIDQTNEHRMRIITAASSNVYCWKIKALKLKSIFHTLSMCSVDVTQKCLIAECWIPIADLEDARSALSSGATTAGSTVLPILNEISHDETPPTHFTLNKFTQGYQNIVDSYGMADYKELNPAPWTIISFPFLFAVMFGDVGHALIMLVSVSGFLIFERQTIAAKIKEELVTIFFNGRYVILMMGLFSLYTGFIYNDIYSKSINIFGSSWATGANNNSCWEWKGLNEVDKWEREAALQNQSFEIMLDPIYCYDQEAGPYPFGIDPVWNIASNKLNFLNSMKMKSAVILGIMQMTFGLCVSLGNHIYNHSLVDIFFTFIPQILFLASIFMYLCVQIIVKWLFFPVDQAWIFGQFYPGSNCAPSLLIGLINMIMMTPRVDGFGEFKNGTMSYSIGDDVNLDDFSNDPNCSISFWYPGESIAEKVLLALAAVSIPLMLLVKPFYLRWRHSRGLPIKLSHGSENGEFSFGDVMVYQAIHTIEFALGCISHTASYLRLWALSLAHAQLSEVLWTLLFGMALQTKGWMGAPMQFFLWMIFAFLSYGILVFMEGLSAFLHALRLHWVEFQSKFYSGDGIGFQPYSFAKQIRIAEGLEN